MKLLPLNCNYCKKTIYRDIRRINESKKFNWKVYCSPQCLSNARNTQQLLKCSNSDCRRSFKRQSSDVRNGNNYCSQSCAASVNNRKFPKRYALRKICYSCGKEFISREKYCSVTCRNNGQTIKPDVIINRIKNFYKINGRIPLKSEFLHTKAARDRFGSWNSAIKAAGFSPNPEKFAKKYFANDGHKCDSLAEKIIDDWLYRKKVSHRRTIAYPSNPRLSVDFLVKDYWIEFFGLAGQHKRYDELRKEKLQIANKYNLKLIEVYPYHLFPKNRLPKILAIL